MAAVLTLIASKIEDRIKAITVANGYSFEWGSVNVAEEPEKTYPSADISYEEETAVEDRLGVHGYAEATFSIRLRGALSSTSTEPYFAIDAELSTILAAVKKALLRDGGVPAYLGLDSGPGVVIKYRGFTKETENAGDVFRPKSLLTKWVVEYQESLT